MPVRAVVFDFGGVLCFHPVEAWIREAAAVCGLSVEAFQHAFWKPRIEYDAGLLEPSEYWNRVAGLAGVTFEPALIPALVRLELKFWSRYDRRVLDWAAQLRARGLGTAILSNLPRPLGEELRATPGFLDPFDHVTFSYELGIVKPQAEIYRDAIEGLGVEPKEALFLDDRPENVEGARAVGMLGEVFSTWEDFLADAHKRHSLPEPARTP